MPRSPYAPPAVPLNPFAKLPWARPAAPPYGKFQEAAHEPLTFLLCTTTDEPAGDRPHRSVDYRTGLVGRLTRTGRFTNYLIEKQPERNGAVAGSGPELYDRRSYPS